MRWIRFTILILVAAILQTSLVQLLALTEAEIKPNLLLILLVYFSVHANGADGIITSFAIGLCADLIGSGVGPQMVSFGLTGSLLTEIRKLIDLRPILNQIIVVVLAGMLSGLLTLPLYAVKGSRLVVVGANIRGRDVGGFVEEASAALAAEAPLPFPFSSPSDLSIDWVINLWIVT